MDNLPVIHNGIDIDKFQFNSSAYDYFLFLGRMTDEKGIHEFLKLSKRMPHIPFVIAGKGNEAITNEVVAFCKKHSNTQYKGMLNYGSPEWLETLSKAKALIMPITYDDPCPLVPLEAMACGTPVIAFDKGSLPEQVTANAGSIIPFSKSVDGLAEGVTEISSKTEEQYRNTRMAARKHVEIHFTADKMAKQYEDLYKQIIETTV